jgi:hypothetical protein
LLMPQSFSFCMTSSCRRRDPDSARPTSTPPPATDHSTRVIAPATALSHIRTGRSRDRTRGIGSRDVSARTDRAAGPVHTPLALLGCARTAPSGGRRHDHHGAGGSSRNSMGGAPVTTSLQGLCLWHAHAGPKGPLVGDPGDCTLDVELNGRLHPGQCGRSCARTRRIRRRFGR